MSQTDTTKHVSTSPDAKRSIRNHLLAGLALTLVVAGGVGGWAATTEISGAVLASGSVVVDSNVKKVQHPSGGVVSAIEARNGDQVLAGNVVLRLDSTVAKANLSIIHKRLIELRARRARLEAERDASNSISFPEELRVHDNDRSRLADNAMAAEQRLFKLREQARQGQKSQLAERVQQLNAEIEGLTAQAGAKAREITLIRKELESARSLYTKKLMSITRMTALERETTRLEGQHAQLLTSIAATRGRVTETQLQSIQIDRDLTSEVARELAGVDASIGEFVEREATATQRLARLEIRAPQSGIVHQSAAHTVGGVLAAGETAMLIVPSNDKLTIEVRVAPRDIDQLQIEQPALLRFTSFNLRTTPELNGNIQQIAADVTFDERAGTQFFKVRISVEPKELARLGQLKVVPGMPVEAFVRTGDRNVLSFLTKPLHDQTMRAFREN